MEKRYLGKMVRVNIFETGKHFLKGEPLPGQFEEEEEEEEAVDLDPEWPSAGKISTRDGDFGEEGCCGECGDDGGGDGDCGEGDDCCKKTPASSLTQEECVTVSSLTAEEQSKHMEETVNDK